MGLPIGGYGLLQISEAPLGLLKGFTCGKGHLDSFLNDTAPFYHRARLGSTSVVLHQSVPDQVLGFFTLSNDAIQLSPGEEYDLGLEDKPGLVSFPAIKIGRFAVAAGHQGQGLGSDIIRLALDQIVAPGAHSAARIAVVDADNQPDVIRFYQKNGFQASQWAEKQAAHQGGKKLARTTVKMLRDVLVGFD